MKPTCILIIMLFFSSILFSHPAERIKVNFDSTGTILSISIVHPVKNKTNHYISSVIIDVNGKEKIKQSFASQFDNTEQQTIYQLIDLKKGDKINITTQCNIAGKKKETITYSFP